MATSIPWRLSGLPDGFPEIVASFREHPTASAEFGQGFGNTRQAAGSPGKLSGKKQAK
jgi:hypothetical protein